MAYARANLFYEREEWKRPVVFSIAFHAFLVVAMFVLGYVMQPRAQSNWGTNQGDAVEAQLVSSAIPIPHPDQVKDNIVATENKGVTQTQPQPKPVETEDGISIKGKVVPPKHIDRPVPPTHVSPRPMPTPVDTAVPYG